MRIIKVTNSDRRRPNKTCLTLYFFYFLFLIPIVLKKFLRILCHKYAIEASELIITSILLLYSSFSVSAIIQVCRAATGYISPHFQLQLSEYQFVSSSPADKHNFIRINYLSEHRFCILVCATASVLNKCYKNPPCACV